MLQPCNDISDAKLVNHSKCNRTWPALVLARALLACLPLWLRQHRSAVHSAQSITCMCQQIGLLPSLKISVALLLSQ